ncbi:phage tail tape measure protein [Rhizobiales bacterium L72]|uniref:Phage tail tape measure protein n=1 Tax=Propylenella binzhouense TaxID=2555902 RepID=A0A964T873_9HYPH|nr:phage tail tape measure protein [Propylenella binzhouense]
MADSLRGLEGLADDFGRAMSAAFRRSALEGKRLDDVLKGLALGLSGRALSQALAPIGTGIAALLESALAGIFGGGAFAAGGAFSGGRVRAFASGGIVAAPTYFPMRGGLGLMGEAGPEAVLPLSRGPDGRLGIRAGGGAGGISVTLNVTARDAESFRRSEAELTALLARAVARGQRGT